MVYTIIEQHNQNFSPSWLREEAGSRLGAWQPDLLATRLGALAHPLRLEIIELLAFGTNSVNNLAVALDVSQTSMSRHLRVLRQAGFITSEPHRNHRLYQLKRPELLKVLRSL